MTKYYIYQSIKSKLYLLIDLLKLHEALYHKPYLILHILSRYLRIENAPMATVDLLKRSFRASVVLGEGRPLGPHHF